MKHPDAPDVDCGWWAVGVSPYDTAGEWVGCPLCQGRPAPGRGWFCRLCLGVLQVYLPVTIRG